MNYLLIVALVAILLCVLLSYKRGLIDNWRESIRWYSTWAFASIATIQGSVMQFITADQMTAKILFAPTWTWAELVQSVITFLAVTGFWGRLIPQPKKTTPGEEPDVIVG